MTGYSLAFFAGIVAVQQFSRLPNSAEWLGLAALALLACVRRHYVVLSLSLGLAWACAFGAWRLAQQLPDRYQNTEIEVEGYIASLPQVQEHRTGFDFVVTSAPDAVPEKMRLSWYTPEFELKAGQSWRFQVKLRKPHGRFNPSGFDYEAWLFANHIGATGYVKSKPPPQRIADSASLGRYLAVCRNLIADKIDAALPGSSQLGVIKALTIGTQNAISQQQWQIFRVTGVVHLIVISGSHIGLIAGWFYLATRRIWINLGLLGISPQSAAAPVAWLAALFYAGLAGFSAPTERAVIMLGVALAAIAWQRNPVPTQVLLWALLAVVLADPLAVLSVGFWLSFVAVALLMYVSVGRLARPAYWRDLAVAQWASLLGLAPLLVLFFQQVSLIAPLANWLAVPLIGIVVVPLALLAIALLFVWPAAASILLQVADSVLQGLWWLLQHLAALPLSQLSLASPPWYALPLATIGILLALAPRGFPGRQLSPLLLIPLFFPAIDKPKSGEFGLTLLDVGQGLATVVRTADHVLLFDTGAKYSEFSDMGESVVLPFLRLRGIAKVDALIVSHGDNDHSGGAESVLAELPVERLLSSVPEWAERERAGYCRAGQEWLWDDVRFRMLAPPQPAFNKENDNSCVLQVIAAGQSALLTGDIEQTAEAWLTATYGGELASRVLVAPHHGSKTSSTQAFLDAVKPEWVLIPAGYANRFGFPHRQVLERYRQLPATVMNTAELGAIDIVSSGQSPVAERPRRRRYWHSD
ncbi:DNA internalization-related competence protein ComEC/Rec2 [Methylomonas sp. EFPC3]|uniref:DNA internalization-related competence protein ComEC/Rec2 n=1 Tax=Methylomonas sp. EFPC3 TaxID=3021710 RepID=UPI002417C742|nr:DNA internalization-related competence protein ComEC/Rec2 [Methylomonas sp. EFPC3]WFP51242.1 DNA internalization-related competence protein ComEC/Rec2 [Methylomonas sp. EFPC3]